MSVMWLLILSAAFILTGFLTGLVYLATRRRQALLASEALAALAVASQIAWIAMIGITLRYCILLDPWGVMSMLTIFGIAASWWGSRRFSSPRLLIAGLALLFAANVAGHLVLPDPGASTAKIGWLLSFHILLVTIGFVLLALGCVSGILILLRSLILKSARWATRPDIPWPALTTMDRFFVSSVGWGVLLFSAGIILGAAAVPGSSIKVAWYADPKVVLTVLGWALFTGVWLMRRRQGFCTSRVVGLATLGFIFMLLGFFADSLLAMGFHEF